jgi:hypothetical protein
MTAQGTALGDRVRRILSPERAGDEMVRPPFQGSEIYKTGHPGRCPGLVSGRTLGPEESETAPVGIALHVLRPERATDTSPGQRPG